MPLRNRITRDVAFSLGGNITDLAGQLLLGIIISRAIGPTGVALYFVGTTVGILILAPLSPGIATLIPREVANGRSSLGELLGTVLSFRVLISLPVSTLAVGLAWWFAPTPYGEAILIGYGLVLFQHLVLTLQSALEAQRRFDLKAMTIVLYRAAVISMGTVSLIFQFERSALLLFQLLATVGVFVVVFMMVARRVDDLSFHVSPHAWAVVARRGYPIVLTSLLFFLNARLDTLILAAYVSPDEVGLYSSSTLLLTAGAAPAFAVVVGVFPSLVARLTAEQDSGMRRVALMLLAYSLATMAVLILFGNTVLGVLFGIEFQAAAPVLALLAVALVPISLNRLALYYLIASDRAANAWYASGLGLGIAVALNFLLIPRVGSYGAAIGTILGETTILLAGLAFVATSRQRARARRCPKTDE